MVGPVGEWRDRFDPSLVVQIEAGMPWRAVDDVRTSHGRRTLNLPAASDRLPDGNGPLRGDARSPARRMAHRDPGPRREVGVACCGRVRGHGPLGPYTSIIGRSKHVEP